MKRIGRLKALFIATVYMFATLLQTLVGGGFVMDVKAANGDVVDFYYYDESGKTLGTSYWTDSEQFGILPVSGNSVSNGWKNSYSFDEIGSSGWYHATLEVVDSTASAGFHVITLGTVASQIDISKEWSNTDIYEKLISQSVVCIYEGEAYDSLTAVNQGFLTTLEATIEKNQDKVADDYISGFEAFESALNYAKDVAKYDLESPAATGELIAANTNLISAADGLVEASLADASIFVKKVSGLSNDFAMGVDISTFISQLDSGVVYKDFEGNALENGEDFMALLASAGINYVRVKVFVDPTDENGNSYGGGHNDLDTAIDIAKYIDKYNDSDSVSENDIKLLVNFHYSDFWTDPGKQASPKAWALKDVDTKASTLGEYTTDSLNAIKTAAPNATIGMVQVGNESNKGIAGVMHVDEDGESNWNNTCKLFSAGCTAVKNFVNEDGTTPLAVVHFADPQNENYSTYAKNLNDNNVDYDVFASSYYPYWHGTLDNLASELTKVSEAYDKDVMVAETQWAFTYDDSDGHGNSVEKSKVGTSLDMSNYSVSVQGQANCVRDTIACVAGLERGVGVFYWEPAWTTVGYAYDENGDLNEEVYANNKEIWETHGSGWASSFSGNYDRDAKEWYGGSAVDNLAMFDFNSQALDSLNVFKYVYTGAKTENVVPDLYTRDSVTITVGDTISSNDLPETVVVTYNDDTSGELPITWNEDDISYINEMAANPAKFGTYVVNGIVTGDTFAVECDVVVEPINILKDYDYSFEENNVWEIKTSEDDAENAIGIKGDNAKSGECNIGFWAKSGKLDATIEQTITIDKPGYYTFTGYMQGKYNTGSLEGDKIYLSVTTGEETVYESDNVVLQGWQQWQQPEVKNILITDDMIENGTNTITLSVGVKIGTFAHDDQEDVWGAIDDMILYYSGEYKAEEKPEETKQEDKTEETTKEVKPVLVSKVNVTGDSKKIAAGKKVVLTAVVTPSNAANKDVAWESSNTGYATVNSKGVVTTKKAGAGKTVTIKATAKDGSGVKATYKISILKDTVKSISLKAKTSVKNGKSLRVKATVKTTGKKVNKTLNWSVSNSKYASITQKGVLKAKKAGKGKTVKVTAKATDGSGKKATMKVKIK